jgi:hypothetical protein
MCRYHSFASTVDTLLILCLFGRVCFAAESDKEAKEGKVEESIPDEGPCPSAPATTRVNILWPMQTKLLSKQYSGL